MKKRPCVLTIAGSDSSAGAGIQADIKAISATGGYAATVITGITAQNTLGVQASHPLPAKVVKQQLVSVFSDLNITVVKIGAVFAKEIINIITTSLRHFKPKFVVIDPVLFSKNGHPLCDEVTRLSLQKKLFPLASLITPNIPEAEKMVNHSITDSSTQKAVAKFLGNKFKINVLVKGGHLSHSKSSDILYKFAENTFYWFHANRIKTNNTHGTGCSLSSAIASNLSQGYTLEQSIQAAKKYLTAAIRQGKKQKIGDGCGPIQHFI